MLPIIWSIAGLDSSGCAGLAADQRAAEYFQTHCCLLLACTTVQSATQCSAVAAVDTASLAAQIEILRHELPPKVVKLGAIAAAETVTLLAQQLPLLNCPVIYDPVIATSSGLTLLDKAAIETVEDQLLPLVDVLTPNIVEAEVFSGLKIHTLNDMELAGRAILATGVKSVFIKGGHAALRDGDIVDYWTDGEDALWLRHPALNSNNNRGSGCTLSSAIAASLASDPNIDDWQDIKSALVRATAFTASSIQAGLSLADGVPGPARLHASQALDITQLPAVSGTAEKTEPQFPRCDTLALGLYPVVDDVRWLEILLPLGIETIQLRIKDQDDATLRQQIAQAVSLQEKYNCRLFVNDHWALAIEYGAYGVHLGQEDLALADPEAIAAAGLRLGISTHSWFELARALSLAPSYIAFGPLYATTTKTMRFVPQGIERLREWQQLLAGRFPVVAIGGIDADNARVVLQTGVGSIAMVRAITEADDTAAAVTQLQQLIEVS